jgi:glutathione S-transferase
MALELYWGSGSPFSWRVTLTLEVKKLAYESKLLEFSKGQNKSPAYLRLNPRGKVPTLKDGDFVLYESLAIMSYLDRKNPDPPLFGKTPEETGLIWRALAECESYMVTAGDKIVRPIFFGKGLDRVEEIQRAAETLRYELKLIDKQLAGSRWLVGDAISAADIGVFPSVQLLLRAASKEAAQPFNLGVLPLAQTFPNIARWVERIEVLPNYERTYPPHWRQ